MFAFETYSNEANLTMGSAPACARAHAQYDMDGPAGPVAIYSPHI